MAAVGAVVMAKQRKHEEVKGGLVVRWDEPQLSKTEVVAVSKGRQFGTEDHRKSPWI